jgi:hypothetical protein
MQAYMGRTLSPLRQDFTALIGQAGESVNGIYEADYRDFNRDILCPWARHVPKHTLASSGYCTASGGAEELQADLKRRPLNDMFRMRKRTKRPVRHFLANRARKQTPAQTRLCFLGIQFI